MLGATCVLLAINQSGLRVQGQYYGERSRIAESFLKKSLEFDFKPSYAELASLYLYRAEFGKDHVSNAKKILNQATEIFKEPRAMYLTGLNFKSGSFNEKNLNKAEYWFEKAAQKGYPLTMEGLARLLGERKRADYEGCYLWGRLGELRGLKNIAIAAKGCKNDISKETAERLDKRALEMNTALERPYMLTRI